MTHKKQNIQKYKSISTGQPCNAAQYIAELVCIRKAEKENKGSLAYKFWNKGDAYQIQIRVANKLIKKYGEKAILYYLNSPDGSNVYSLGFLHKSKKFVLPLDFVKNGVEKSKKIVDAELAKPKKIVEKLEGEYKPRKTSPNKKSLLNKLRKADGSG
tara:strand:- start:17 stop:487 length:471 start_codon:yes stop_codon:yes gene_type:complete